MLGQQQPGLDGAALPGVDHRGDDAHVGDMIFWDVVQDDRCAFAAKLELQALDRGGSGRHDRPPGRGRAGESDHVDQRVGGHLLADLRPAGDDVEHAWRKVGILSRFGDFEGVKRRPLVRLEHHGAAGRQSRQDLHDVEEEREVERGNRGHHTDRFADNSVPGHSGRTPGRRRHFGPPHREFHGLGNPLGDVDGAAHLNDVGEEADRPGLGHHQLLEEIVALIKNRGESA